MRKELQALAIAWLVVFFACGICRADPYDGLDPVRPSLASTAGHIDLLNDLRIPFPYSAVRRPRSHSSELADHLTMTHFPSGSVRTRYDGPLKILVRHARKHYRRHWNARVQRNSAFWSAGRYTRYLQYSADLWEDHQFNGQWYQRKWWESLPPEKGGAPREPYERVIGNEASISLGPLTFTNTLRFKLDYVAIFDVNTDPTPRVDPLQPIGWETRDRVSVDVRPIASGATVGAGSEISFKVRPHVRVGFPRGGEWHSALRRISIRAEFLVTYVGKTILRGECEARFRAPDGAAFTVQLALLNW